MLEVERLTVSDMADSSALMYSTSLARVSSSPLPERLRTLCLMSMLDMPWMITKVLFLLRVTYKSSLFPLLFHDCCELNTQTLELVYAFGKRC